jgi:tetratricopeptide (TPR) repeat protein
VVGAIGGGRYVEYGALGEVVSDAASLQSLARPGTALVGPATRAAAGHLFTWGDPEGPDAGGPGQGAAYLDAPLAAGSQLRLGARGPIVGRRAELRALDAALREAIAGRGSVVLLRGEPGLGKTRLVQECRTRFMAWAGARDGRLPLWLESRSASYTSATPYGLYQQLLAGWTGVPPDQPRPVARAALEKALSALLASTDLLPALEHVMGLVPAARREEMGPEELRRIAFTALRTVISRLVPARRPAVIVLEDLHWADPTSLKFTRELVALTVGRPLLILATTRPDHGPEVGDLAAAPGVRTVELRPLPDAAARELARELIGDAGPGAGPGEDVIDAVVETVDGNPLFLEERLSVLLETGALTGGPGGWRLVSGPGPAVPQVLDRLVRSRIDLLTPAAQDVVRVASVLGPQFLASVLCDVCAHELITTPNAPRPRPEFTTALRELAASGILRQVPGSPPAGGPEPGGLETSYQFRHALIQEAAYYGILRADRRRLHGRAAAALEAARSSSLDEIAAVLGRHYAAAGMSAKAIRYLELAGDNATWSFANDEAISAYQEALAVTRETADADAGARLQAKLANVLWRTARKDETRAAFTEALRLSATLAPGGAAPGPPPAAERLRRAWLLTRLGRLEMADGRHAAARGALDDALAILGDAPAGSDDEADVWLELMIDGRAALLLVTGDVAGGRAALELARPVLEARGRPSRRYSYHQERAFERVNPAGLRADDEALAHFRRGLAAARESHDTKDIGYATYFVGWALWLRRELDEAHRYLTEALEIAERVGEVLLRSNSLGSLVLVALARHDTATVRALAPRAQAAAEAFEPSLRSWAIAPLAWLAWQDGRPGDVIAIAERTESVAPATKVVLHATSYRWVYLFPLTALYLDRGDTGTAVAQARRVLAEDQQALPGDLAAAVRAAAGAWDSGVPDDAAAGLREALRLASAQGYF